MDRLSVLCFAGTYTLALASDLVRFVLRTGTRWYLTVGLTTLGWVVQTAYLANLARQGHRLPVATVFESLLVLSWILTAIDLYLVVRSPRESAVGLFILPLVLVLVVLAGLTAPRADWTSWGGQVFFWGAVHGLFLMAGAVSTCVAFAAGLMYLVQSHRLKHKRPPWFGFTISSLEQSERLNRAAITVAFPLLTCGLLIGVVLVVAVERTGQTPIAWTDPKVVSALAMWVVFALLLHARFRPAMRGRTVMIWTMIAFAFMIFTWVGVNLLHLPTTHGVPQPAGRAL
jgi:ABC-type transport system involved in cytochrome c biogenesis permease subunit